jgi:predicted deacylase
MSAIAQPEEFRAGSPEATLPADLPDFPVAIKAPDITPYLAGNTGVPGFTTIAGAAPGPHVVLVSLIHGNEIAGAVVLAGLLDAGFTPARGRLTFGFANIAAFARFDPTHPLPSRYVEEDLNRVWDDAQLFGVRRSAELDRAREMLPLIDTADMLLDLHTMLWPSEPVLLCGPSPQGRALARAVGSPPAIVADLGHAGGKRLIDYGRFTEAGGRAAAILVEAGQHWQPPGLAQTRATVMALLAHAGMVASAPPAQPPPLLAEVTATITARTNRFVFVHPYRGGDIVPHADTLIAHDGDEEIRTPHDNCLLVMPSLRAARGHTAVRLARVVRGS